MEILRVEHCSKTYGYRGNLTHALKDISFSVSEGEFVGIMGASGSGKTTLLNCISTVDKPTKGCVYLGGEDLTALSRKATANFRREKLGFVFQDFNLLDTLTCGENIALALSIQHYPGKKWREKSGSGTKFRVGAYPDIPYEVSGGEKKNSLCPCHRTDPLILLADEPTRRFGQRVLSHLDGDFSDLNRVTRRRSLWSPMMPIWHPTVAGCSSSRRKFFNEIYRGEDTQRNFYERILDVTGFLGGKIHEIQSGFAEC